MKHVVLILAALLLAAVGLLIIGANAKGITGLQLLASIGCIAFALALAIPAHFKDAAGAVASGTKQLKDALGFTIPGGPPAPPTGGAPA